MRWSSNDIVEKSIKRRIKEDGKPDFGLFCWFSYVWDDELGVMCCIGGNKLTRRNIERDKGFLDYER